MTDVFDQLQRQVTNLGKGLDGIDTARIGDALVAADSIVQESREVVGTQRATIAEQTEQLNELTTQLQSINASIPRLLSDLQQLAHQLVRAGGNSDTAARRWPRWPFNQ